MVYFLKIWLPVGGGGGEREEKDSLTANPQRTLHSSNAPLLQIPLVKGTFQDTM